MQKDRPAVRAGEAPASATCAVICLWLGSAKSRAVTLQLLKLSLAVKVLF